MSGTAVIAGIGEGLGISLATVFAAAGYDVLGLSRTDRVAAQAAAAVQPAGRTYRHGLCDLADPGQVGAALAPDADRIELLVHTAHSLLIRPFTDTGIDEFVSTWRNTCLTAAVAARAVLPAMRQRASGTILLTGATAGIRGGANFAAFASAKFALRGLAQALAREYGPSGIHVAHIVLDSLIEEPQSTRRFGASQRLRMDAAAVAAACLQLSQQPRSAWTHELDLRPQGEPF